MRAIDRTGKRYGDLVVIEKSTKRVRGDLTWRCQCDCGNEKLATAETLQCGGVKSCGCRKHKKSPETVKKLTKHGLSGDPTYKSWMSMLTRCYNQNADQYPEYGGRGISCCEFIRTCPANIVILIGLRPNGMTLDRIDSNGNYSCGQCAECLQKKWIKNIRWATPKQQANNRRNNKILTILGETKSLSEWSSATSLPKHVISSRYHKNWPQDKILGPVDKRFSHPKK